jgi:hypothetical protein
MEPTKPRPGGRPPTPWNSSRKRKLVRLFMLTTLTQVEIEDVLKAEGFSPRFDTLFNYSSMIDLCLLSYSWSDIQKKLRALLPRDYRKDWRKYRPSDSSNLRFKGLSGGRKDPGRDPQQNTVCSKTSLENGSSTRSHQSYPHLESFEGPLSAFRNHSSQATTTPATCDSISPSTSDSLLVVPSRLLLDGSTIGAWWPSTNGNSISTSVSVPSTSTCLNFGIAKQCPREANSIPHRDAASVISFHSLEQRISDRSSSIICHVYSVLCYSIASSSGSNSSGRSSWWSRERLAKETKSAKSASLGTEAATRDEKQANRESPSKRRFFLWKKNAQDQNAEDQDFQIQSSYPSLPELTELSEGEQRVWNEMIDEAQVVATPIISRDQLHTSFMSLRMRRCCAREGRILHVTNMCEICLSLPVHRLAGHPEGLPRIQSEWKHLLDQRDVFDHTPLHFAAASQCRKSDLISSLISLIKLGANIHAVNTYGDTFLHTLLGFVEFDELQDCFSLFRFLATLDFPFCQRDYHGRTPLHIFLERCQTLERQSFEVLEEMLDIMKPEIESMDNLGLTVSHYFSTRSVNMSAQGQAAELLSKYRTWHNIDINFRSKLDETTGNWEIWNAWVATAGRSTWVDLDGDTALIALIKYWTFDTDEFLLVELVKQLVIIGAQIRSRDRSGDTALTIASMRGFRLVVNVLLEAGASAYSKNYRGVPVLKEARKAMFQARKSGNDRLYATILSCIVLLVDSGANERLRDNRQGLGQYIASWVSHDQAVEVLGFPITRVLAQSGFL